MRSITNKIHIIGSGLAGLSTAINAIKKKIDCEVYESSKNAGGRCRSFFDKQINLKIDKENKIEDILKVPKEESNSSNKSLSVEQSIIDKIKK